MSPTAGKPDVLVARLAARVAVLALRSSVNQGYWSPNVAYTLGPSRDLLSLDQVIDVLATMPKPLSCRAETEGEQVHLTCASIKEPKLAEEVRTFGVQSAAAWSEGVRKVCGPDSHDPRVLLASSQEAVVVPLSGVLTFIRDYDTPHSLAWQSVHPAMLPPGVCALFTMGPPDRARVTISDSVQSGS